MKLGKIAEITGGRLIGDPEVGITGIAGLRDARPGDITLLSSPSFVKFVGDCPASAIITSQDFESLAGSGRNIIVSANPLLAFALAAEAFAGPVARTQTTSPLASVSDSAQISPGASILPFACVGAGAKIGKDAVVHPFVSIGEDVIVGDSTVIYPHVTIYGGTVIGNRVIIHSGSVIGSDGFGYVWDGSGHHKIPQLGIVEIEDDVEIGANVTIDRASLGKTTIGKGTKIDNLVQIAHNVSIGRNSVIIAQVGIAGSARIGNNVILAGQAGVRDHITVGNNVKAGGQTGITKNVPDNSEIAGTPHMAYKDWLKLSTYLKRLPKLFERMRNLEKRLGVEIDHD